ncbi:MAG: putative quinol monooxygenase [Microthrixaceae bacterium]
MIIVSGPLWVDESLRDSFLDGCRAVAIAARAAEGCLEFHLSPDPLELDRVNVYEEWESVEAAAAFRGSGPSPEQAAVIRDARLMQHDVSSSKRL